MTAKIISRAAKEALPMDRSVSRRLTNGVVLGMLFAALLTAAVGCGADEYPARVTGKVTIDGKPAPHGWVGFHPVDDVKKVFYGVIDSNGEYYVQVVENDKYRPGLRPGEYFVAVIVPVQPIDAPIPQPSMGKLMTDKKFSQPKNSGIKHTVKEGSNKIDLQASAEPPAAKEGDSTDG